MDMRIGYGYDVHKLEAGKELFLGGVEIPSPVGCVAHSDGDVLIHAICDALLGAANLGDIGHHFPDTDPQYKGIRSTILLEKTLDLIKAEHFEVVNVDSTICLQKPRLSGFIDEIKSSLSSVLQCNAVSVKATTTEKLGFVGEEKGISAHAIVLLQKRN